MVLFLTGFNYFFYHEGNEAHEEKDDSSTVSHGHHDFDQSLFPDIGSDDFSLSVDRQAVRIHVETPIFGSRYTCKNR